MKRNPKVEIGSCVHPYCMASYRVHYWGKVKAAADGWFFQKSGEAWCPNHIPEWVELWRSRRLHGS